MLRLCPSEICLTREDIERVTQRMATRREAGPSRTPVPLRRSIQHQHQRATVRPGPGRSRDDAVVHEYPGLAMRPHFQAEYVSTRTNSSHIKASARLREDDRHADFVDSTSESESDLSSLSSSPPDRSLNQLNDSVSHSEPTTLVQPRSYQCTAESNLLIPSVSTQNSSGGIPTKTQGHSTSSSSYYSCRDDSDGSARPAGHLHNQNPRLDLTASAPNLTAALRHHVPVGLGSLFSRADGCATRSSSGESAIVAAHHGNRSPLEVLQDNLIEHLSHHATPPSHPRVSRHRHSRFPRNAATPEITLPITTSASVADRVVPGVPHFPHRRRQLDDQENSEEAAMSVLSREVTAMYARSRNAGEVMDTTPPPATRVSRYL